MVQVVNLDAAQDAVDAVAQRVSPDHDVPRPLAELPTVAQIVAANQSAVGPRERLSHDLSASRTS